MIRGLNISVLFTKMAQVTVVSKGMKWTQDAANKAAKNHQYIKVGPKSGYLLLSGAPGRWKKPETAGDVYVPSLRVAGNPASIRQLFIGLGVSAADIDAHLARAYTAQNYQGAMKQAFDAEVAQYNAYKAQKDATKAATGGPDVTLDELEYFVSELGKATTVAKTTAGSPKAAGSPRGRAGRVQDLTKRLADATAKGKVLDVSKMDLAKGTGAKMIANPGPNSKKVGVAGLAIVSSDPARFAAAVRQLGAQYEPYIAQYNAAVARRGAIAAPVGSPAGVPALPSPGSPLAGGVALPFAGGLPTVPGTATVGSPPVSPFQ